MLLSVYSFPFLSSKRRDSVCIPPPFCTGFSPPYARINFDHGHKEDPVAILFYNSLHATGMYSRSDHSRAREPVRKRFRLSIDIFRRLQRSKIHLIHHGILLRFKILNGSCSVGLDINLDITELIRNKFCIARFFNIGSFYRRATRDVMNAVLVSIL